MTRWIKNSYIPITIGFVATLMNCSVFFINSSRHPTWVYVADENTRCPTTNAHKHETEVVMFIPSPMHWKERRRPVIKQFLREQWTNKQAVLIFVFGTTTGHQLEHTLDTSNAEQLPGANYIFTKCRDIGDEFDNPNGTSSTTCKVYEACVYISQHYNAKYVWRGADDSYVNLKLFFRIMPLLPKTRLYLGRYRDVSTDKHDNKDLQLDRQPLLQTVFGLFQFGGYMHGEGFVFSYDVAEFIGTLSIPPHQTWCEDVMVGMWLNPFRVTKMDFSAVPGQAYNPPLVTHYMKDIWWDKITQDGTLDKTIAHPILRVDTNPV